MLYLSNTISTITITRRTMLKMTKIATIAPKMAGALLFPVVLIGISGDVHKAGVLIGICVDVNVVRGVGQLQVEGSCVSTTPANKKKTDHF